MHCILFSGYFSINHHIKASSIVFKSQMTTMLMMLITAKKTAKSANFFIISCSDTRFGSVFVFLCVAYVPIWYVWMYNTSKFVITRSPLVARFISYFLLFWPFFLHLSLDFIPFVSTDQRFNNNNNNIVFLFEKIVSFFRRNSLESDSFELYVDCGRRWTICPLFSTTVITHIIYMLQIYLSLSLSFSLSFFLAHSLFRFIQIVTSSL